MMRSMLSRIALSLLVVSGAASADEAAKAAAPKADAARGKTVATAMCGACHGNDGNSAISANPKLAGQHADYLAKQLHDFKSTSDSARKNAVMSGMAAALNDEQIRDIAAYFAEQKQSNNASKNKATLEQGQKLYRAGDVSKGLAACAACHGPAGAGMPAQYPRLAGQHAEYIEAQLKSFRDGGRVNDPAKMMRMVALKMTDAEIKAVSDYIAGLR